ncbi:Rpn family recombination-promoting nuclease/putative transposase [Clostridium butyricum]|uniref:Rpn family recombination-promoting nuclease/putative transposase n=1 Tax=Clostridium butyricum TaxID=1492 RepID=UPI00374F6EDC
MSRRLLNPKVDFILKKIFGSENHPNILISFLNAVMKPVDKIVSVVINNTEITKDFLEDKFSRLDVKATTNKGKIINIEIQIKTEYNMIKRSLYYWSKLYEEQLSEGDKYETLSRTVCINILDFKYLDNDRFHNGYRLKELELYNLRKKSFYDKISALSNAEKKGREEGKLLERINIAKNLLDVLDNETISLKTGLSVEEIEKLR